MAKRSNLQIRAEYYALRLILGLLGFFPLGVSMRFGRRLGGLLARLFPRLTKTARRNLEIALPGLSPQEKEDIIRGTFASLGRHLGFIAHFGRFTEEDVRRIVEVIGKEHFDRAFATGRGVLFFTGHFGSWEVFNILSPAFGHTMNILVRRIDNPLIERYVDRLRTRLGNRTIDKRRGARKLYRLLEKSEIVGILADLNVQEREGVFVDFFGVPASTTTSIAKLALKTGAFVLPAFAVWEEKKQKYVVYLEPPLAYEKTGETAADVHELTQQITRTVEAYVRRYPEQWLWIHKRWNTRPEGEPELY